MSVEFLGHKLIRIFVCQSSIINIWIFPLLDTDIMHATDKLIANYKLIRKIASLVKSKHKVCQRKKSLLKEFLSWIVYFHSSLIYVKSSIQSKLSTAGLWIVYLKHLLCILKNLTCLRGCFYLGFSEFARYFSHPNILLQNIENGQKILYYM